jgi:hypothetical protein
MKMTLSSEDYSEGSVIYCSRLGRVSLDTIRLTIQSALSIGPDDANLIMDRAEKIIKTGISEIHGTYMDKLGSEERAKQRMKEGNPDINLEGIEALYGYASWCVAKGA